MMTRQITIAFANSGDKTTIPDSVQVDGTVSYTEGFSFDYQRPLASSPLAKNIERVSFNQLMYDVTSNIQQYQQIGTPEWYAGTYGIYSRVINGGVFYTSTEAANNVTPTSGIQEWAATQIPISEDHEGNISHYWPIESAVGAGTIKFIRLASLAITIGDNCTNVAVLGCDTITIGDNCTNTVVLGSSNSQVDPGIGRIVLASNRVIGDTDYEVVMGVAFVGSASSDNITIRINAQTGIIKTNNLGNLYGFTTGATVTRLTKDGNAAAANNQYTIVDDSAHLVRGEVAAFDSATGDSKAFTFTGLVKRSTGAGSTALVAAITPVVVAMDAGATTWVLAVTADTTLGCLALSVTGVAATNISWNASLFITKVE